MGVCGASSAGRCSITGVALGDFDLFVGARQCTPISLGCVTARSHYCWYDMSYGSRTRAHRWGYMSSSGLAALHSAVHYSRYRTLSIAFHVKEMGNEEPGRPHGRMPPSFRRPARSGTLVILSLDRGEGRHEKIMVRL